MHTGLQHPLASFVILSVEIFSELRAGCASSHQEVQGPVILLVLKKMHYAFRKYTFLKVALSVSLSRVMMISTIFSRSFYFDFYPRNHHHTRHAYYDDVHSLENSIFIGILF